MTTIEWNNLSHTGGKLCCTVRQGTGTEISNFSNMVHCCHLMLMKSYFCLGLLWLFPIHCKNILNCDDNWKPFRHESSNAILFSKLIKCCSPCIRNSHCNFEVPTFFKCSPCMLLKHNWALRDGVYGEVLLVLDRGRRSSPCCSASNASCSPLHGLARESKSATARLQAPTTRAG